MNEEWQLKLLRATRSVAKLQHLHRATKLVARVLLVKHKRPWKKLCACVISKCLFEAVKGQWQNSFSRSKHIGIQCLQMVVFVHTCCCSGKAFWLSTFRIWSSRWFLSHIIPHTRSIWLPTLWCGAICFFPFPRLVSLPSMEYMFFNRKWWKPGEKGHNVFLLAQVCWCAAASGMCVQKLMEAALNASAVPMVRNNFW